MFLGWCPLKPTLTHTLTGSSSWKLLWCISQLGSLENVPQISQQSRGQQKPVGLCSMVNNRENPALLAGEGQREMVSFLLLPLVGTMESFVNSPLAPNKTSKSVFPFIFPSTAIIIFSFQSQTLVQSCTPKFCFPEVKSAPQRSLPPGLTTWVLFPGSRIYTTASCHLTSICVLKKKKRNKTNKKT